MKAHCIRVFEEWGIGRLLQMQEWSFSTLKVGNFLISKAIILFSFTTKLSGTR